MPLFIRELVVGGWVGVLLIGHLLTGPWLIRLPGFVPLSWVRLPKVSLVFETPYCPSADVPQASIQKIDAGLADGSHYGAARESLEGYAAPRISR